MQTIENVKATGQLNITIRDIQGKITQEMTIPNLVVTVGKAWIAARMKDTGSPTQMTHMAIGSGNVSPVVGDTALGSELGRVALTTAGGTVASNVVTYQATFGAGVGTGAVTEAAILNNSTGGTMLCRTTFAVVNKGANDTMAVTWTCTLS